MFHALTPFSLFVPSGLRDLAKQEDVHARLHQNPHTRYNCTVENFVGATTNEQRLLNWPDTHRNGES